MRFISKSKIGRLSAKKGKIYPQIRLPPQLVDTIGGISDVFETERYGKRVSNCHKAKQSVLDDDTVLQLFHRVVKLNDQTEYDQSFKALESQINDLRSMLL